jgi:hypothetical protein
MAGGLLVAGLAVMLLFIAACGGSDDNGSATPSGSGAPSGSLTSTPASSRVANEQCQSSAEQIGLVSQVETPKGIFDPGEPVEITLVLADCADNDATLHFPTTQRYDFTIVDANGNEVWKSSDGKSFAQTEGTEVMTPGQTVRYTETWDQKDRDGNQAPDGVYKLSAFSVGCIAEARSGCEFGPVRNIQIGASIGAGTATATPAPSV